MSDSKKNSLIFSDETLFNTLLEENFVTSKRYPKLKKLWFNMTEADALISYLGHRGLPVSSSGFFVDSSECVYFIWNLQSLTLSDARRLVLKEFNSNQ